MRGCFQDIENIFNDIVVNKLKIVDITNLSILFVGGEKISFPTNEIYVGSGGPNQNSTIGLMHGSKAIGEDPWSPLYFMPWA